MNSSFDKRKKYSNKEINMINEYEKLTLSIAEDLNHHHGLLSVEGD